MSIRIRNGPNMLSPVLGGQRSVYCIPTELSRGLTANLAFPVTAFARMRGNFGGISPLTARLIPSLLRQFVHPMARVPELSLANQFVPHRLGKLIGRSDGHDARLLAGLVGR